ncbi:maleylpyruvate isomerase N-terminal domain-containing protein [Micromonospora sp. WMMD987]|jgi:hypothetical protein|uniref:maleylpyruvate isomerase N-terminal domain-containing protein n=1 Tax=Micromonospora TaxID=1873 RepID=UPI002499BF34|nr:maleylpyruvate isomerase N-terminal domain-containing protein [Micromonospora sp. WMMD987]WFE95170.1 maleylpyruvate isomerase N-terminal domain-containing protein [Micromonospora sp. WMMD987]
MVDPTALLADPTESGQLDALVTVLPPGAWTRPAPAPGRTVAHRIARLAWVDHVARATAVDPAAYHGPVIPATDPGRLVEDAAAGFLAPPRVARARRVDREGAAA